MKKQITLQISIGLCITILLIILSCSSDDSTIVIPTEIEPISLDINDDGQLNILIIGTSTSINSSSSGFATDVIAEELHNILSQDAAIDSELHIAYEDIYSIKEVTFGLGQGGSVFNTNHYAHSLMQYYYWPDGQSERWDNLASDGAYQWDYVIVGADPYIISNVPGYYALGVNKVVSKISEGGAKPMLLMPWPKNETNTVSIDHFEEFTYRTADHAIVEVDVIPTGLAWKGLPSSKKDLATEHPSPNGAYLAAASIYAQLSDRSAAHSSYNYDDEIANSALETISTEADNSHYSGERSFVSPFKSCDIDDIVLNYNHTGTSSENGILNGLQWVIAQSDRTLTSGGTPPINFNYGRANTNFEPNKRYNIDPSQFDFSIGFPMQDNGNHGDTSLLYGLDKRYDDANNGTDLGTALYMIRNSELPNARAIPVRTLYAQIKDAIPSQSAYSDNWHMHGNLNRAIGAYMYTLLTGSCALGEAPDPSNSVEWNKWMCHKIGYETAYSLMYLKGNVPSCNE